MQTLDPAFILVEPQLGENIGAVARAMLNCGLTDLRLVAPRDGWPNPAANGMASGADVVLEQARVFDRLEDAVTDLNVKGAYFLTRAVARGLIEAGKPGSLINISSQMAHVAGVDRAVYAATKHAVEGFTKAMAIEWGPNGIRVNTICPTFIRTPLGAQTLDIPERRAWIESMIKLGRVGEVEDVMGACVFLASDASALVTGSALMVDGGWTAD